MLYRILRCRDRCQASARRLKASPLGESCPPQRTDEGKPYKYCFFTAGHINFALIRRFAPPSPSGEGFYSVSSASNSSTALFTASVKVLLFSKTAVAAASYSGVRSASSCFKAAPPFERGRPPVARRSSGRRTHSTGPFWRRARVLAGFLMTPPPQAMTWLLSLATLASTSAS